MNARANIAATRVPLRMKHLRVDRRGYPVPWIVVVDADNVPHFAFNDIERQRAARDLDLCGICGQKLLRLRWFVGGALSAFHPEGAFFDGPMHTECAHYALKVCPYLALRKYGEGMDADKAASRVAGMTAWQEHDSVLKGRPMGDMFFAVKCDGQTTTGENHYYKPNRPYVAVEYWRHGEQVSGAWG